MPWPNRPRAVGLGAAAALLAACTTVGPNFHTPAAPAAPWISRITVSVQTSGASAHSTEATV